MNLDNVDDDENKQTYGGLSFDQIEKVRNLLISRREQQKITQREIGRRAGISQMLISNAERTGYLSGRALDYFKMLAGYGIEPNDIARIIGTLKDTEEPDNERVIKLHTIMAGLNTLSNRDLDVIERIISGMSK